MVERSSHFWLTVIFCESQFYLYSDSGRMRFWRLSNQEFYINILQPTVKHVGYSVIVWGAVWSDGHSELVEYQASITYVKYVSILQDLLPIFSSGMKNDG